MSYLLQIRFRWSQFPYAYKLLLRNNLCGISQRVGALPTPCWTPSKRDTTSSFRPQEWPYVDSGSNASESDISTCHFNTKLPTVDVFVADKMVYNKCQVSQISTYVLLANHERGLTSVGNLQKFYVRCLIYLFIYLFEGIWLVSFYIHKNISLVANGRKLDRGQGFPPIIHRFLGDISRHPAWGWTFNSQKPHCCHALGSSHRASMPIPGLMSIVCVHTWTKTNTCVLN